MRIWPLVAGLTLTLAGVTGAQAQYYPPPYGGPPPPGYRCDAHYRTPYGPRGLVCPLERPKPLGFRCECVVSPAPGYPYGPPLRGRVIP